jgi:hypothetical protein
MDLLMDPLKIREQVMQQLYQHDQVEVGNITENQDDGNYLVMEEQIILFFVSMVLLKKEHILMELTVTIILVLILVELLEVIEKQHFEIGLK